MTEGPNFVCISARQERLLLLDAVDDAQFTTTLTLRVKGAERESLVSTVQAVASEAQVLRLRLSRHPVLSTLEVEFPPLQFYSDEHCDDLSSRTRWGARIVESSDGASELQLAVPAYCADAASMTFVAAEIARRLSRKGTAEPTPSFWQVAEWWAELTASDAAPTGAAYWRERVNELGAASHLHLPRVQGRKFRFLTFSRALPVSVIRRIRELEAGGKDIEPGAVVLAAWTVLMARRFSYTGPLGVGLDGRHDPELAEVIGPLACIAPLRSGYESAKPFSTLVRELSFGLFEASAWQGHFSWGNDRIDADAPIPYAPFVWQRACSLGTLKAEFGIVEVVHIDSLNDRFRLRLRDLGDEIALDADADYLSKPGCEWLLDGLITLLRAASELPTTTCGELPIASDRELSAVRERARIPDGSFSLQRVIERFESCVRAEPDRTAVECGERAISRAFLDRMATDLAVRLQRARTAPETFVAMHLGLSVELIVTILAAMKAEMPFVPIDPSLPPARAEAQLLALGPVVIVTDSEESIPSALLSRLDARIERVLSPTENQPKLIRRVEVDTLAYAMFTSGSTGDPKCVGITARALNNQIDWFVRQFNLDGTDRVLVRTQPNFDAMIWETIAPACAGATAVVLDSSLPFDIDAMLRTIANGEVTRIQVTPDLLRRLLHEPGLTATSLRTLFSGGDILDAELMERASNLLDVEVVNLYGPCETCVQVTSWNGDARVHRGPVPVGLPINNVSVTSVGRDGCANAFGVVGELMISGAALGRGYIGDPRTTAEKFVPDPLGAAEGERAYRSGDYGIARETGELVVFGRLDHQTKIRGARVELPEVRRALLNAPGVRDCVAVVEATNAAERALVALVECDPDVDADVYEKKLLAYANESMPYWMVPTRFVFRNSLPRLSSGKIDHVAAKRLVEQRSYEAPQTPEEHRIAEIWREVLGATRIGRHDNFFELGGQSLLLMRVAVRVREVLGVDAPLLSMYQAKTLAKLAKLVCELRTVQGSAAHDSK